MEVLGGLLASGAIFLLLLLIILGPLVGYFESARPTLLWVAAFYAPYLIIGSISLHRHWGAFGSTLLITGVVAVIALIGFVLGLFSVF